jgi:hypothetical protein
MVFSDGRIQKIELTPALVWFKKKGYLGIVTRIPEWTLKPELFRRTVFLAGRIERIDPKTGKHQVRGIFGWKKK